MLAEEGRDGMVLARDGRHGFTYESEWGGGVIFAPWRRRYLVLSWLKAMRGLRAPFLYAIALQDYGGSRY